MDLREIKQAIIEGRTLNELSLNVAYYARVSTEREEQQSSLENQIGYFDDYISNRSKWTLAERYIDEGISGGSVNKRGDFLRMINDAKLGKMDLILTKEISRFSRNTLDSIKYTRELLSAGVGVLFINDNINTLSPDAELRLTIMASLAQDEMRRLSERVKFGIKRAYETGRLLGNDTLYGYKKANGKLVIDEDTAPFVRELFRIYGEGKYGFRTIARMMSENGYRNRNGDPLNPGTLNQILSNPKYKGYYNGRLTESIDYQTKARVDLPKKEQLCYKDENIPVLVSEELWDRVQNILKDRAERYTRKTSPMERYFYSQKLICGIHGTHLYRKLWKDRKTPVETWNCKIYLAQGRKACPTPYLYTSELDVIMDAIGRQYVSNRVAITNELIGLYENAAAETVNHDKEISKLTKELSRAAERKRRLLGLLADDTITKDDFKKMNGDINEACARAESKIAEFNNEKKKALAAADMYKQAKAIGDASADDLVPLMVAKDMLDKIVVEPGSTSTHIMLTVSLKYQPELAADIYRARSKTDGETGKRIVIGADPVSQAPAAVIYSANDTFIFNSATEVSPIVGSEKQSEDLVKYLLNEFEENPIKIWDSNIFGKSLHELVNEGLHTKLARMPADARMRLQETLERVINEGCSGLICIIL